MHGQHSRSCGCIHHSCSSNHCGWSAVLVGHGQSADHHPLVWHFGMIQSVNDVSSCARCMLSQPPVMMGEPPLLSNQCMTLRSSKHLPTPYVEIQMTAYKKGLCGMQRVQPETRTYNTAIIACNMCNQSAKALQVTSLTAVIADTSFVNTMRC